MAKAPVWRGSTAIKEAPDSMQLRMENGKSTCVRKFHGPFNTLVAQQPEYNDSMTGIDESYKVASLTITRMGGRKGSMVVTLTKRTRSELAVLNDPVTDPEIELEWAQLEKPLLTHSIYRDESDPDGAGTKTLTWEDRTALGKWESESDLKVKAGTHADCENDRGGYHDADNNVQELSENAWHYAQKVLNGVESYLVFQPVVRRTREYLREISDASGARELFTAAELKVEIDADVPDLSTDGKAWVYMQTADTCTRSGESGRWRRVEEWTGAESWDPDLYGPV